MKILVVEDNPVMQKLLQSQLSKWGYEAELAGDGRTAWNIVLHTEEPILALIDWMMPEMDGIELIRNIRKRPDRFYIYVILLTSKNCKEDLVTGLGEGADDFIRKPFDPNELRARMKAGFRILDLQQKLEASIIGLEQALSQVKTLQGLLPICAYCKKIRDGRNYWHQVERYISEHTEAEFTHGICPDCYRELMASVRPKKTASFNKKPVHVQ
jgi:sigma-B regulation protein RsbU (phosphoserine phosphatase)